MAVHLPKNLSYVARLNAWLAGNCPYCNHDGILGSSSPTKRSFRCPACGAENNFTLPRLFEEKKICSTEQHQS